VTGGRRFLGAVGGLEPQRDAVDAVPLVRGGGVALALEDVTEMAVAVAAQHLDAAHPQRVVGAQDDRVGVGRIEERRPPAVRFELLGAAEQFRSAGAARVHAFGLGVRVLTDMWRFGACLPEHVVLLGRQMRAPLAVVATEPRFGEAGILCGTHAPTLIRRGARRVTPWRVRGQPRPGRRRGSPGRCPDRGGPPASR
jgi:hypothetical protein